MAITYHLFNFKDRTLTLWLKKLGILKIGLNKLSKIEWDLKRKMTELDKDSSEKKGKHRGFAFRFGYFRKNVKSSFGRAVKGLSRRAGKILKKLFTEYLR